MDQLTGYQGGAPDNRSQEQKDKDFTDQDILGGSLEEITWIAKDTWKTLDIRKQSTSSSCGGQSAAKVLTSFFNEILSASPIYRARANFPGEGMSLQDIGSILMNKGTTLEAFCASQNMTEAEMNAIAIPTELSDKIQNRYLLPAGENINMDLLAKALDQGHGLIIGISSNKEEWQEVPALNKGKITFTHYVASVPENYLLHNGEKSVVIDDSCNAFSSIKGTGQRILTESFLKTRSWGILALVPRVESPVQEKPKHTFYKILSFGMTDPEVEEFQKVLQYEKFLPVMTSTNTPLPLGYWGPMTAQACLKWQIAHGITDFQNEPDIKKIRFGNKSIYEINDLYAI